jgi:4-hydroxy-tetrahydrodipicolinate synthase
VHYQLLPLLTGNFLESNPGPVKAVMKMLGIIEHDTMRAPLAPVTASTRDALQRIVRECSLQPEAATR